jgi:DNA-binding NarL/FixJ family response regulator
MGMAVHAARQREQIMNGLGDGAPLESKRTPALPFLPARAASLLSSIRTERAKLLQLLDELQRNTAQTVRTARSLKNQFTDVPREAEIQEATRRLKTLSRRQRQILDKVIASVPNKGIAFDLGLSEKTVETHRARLMRKLGARSLPDLVRITLRAHYRLPTAGYR